MATVRTCDLCGKSAISFGPRGGCDSGEPRELPRCEVSIEEVTPNYDSEDRRLIFRFDICRKCLADLEGRAKVARA